MGWKALLEDMMVDTKCEMHEQDMDKASDIEK